MMTASNDPPAQDKSPPKPPFALAIGVVGHRPDRLPKDEAAYRKLEAEVARVLGEISREARVVCDRYYEFFAVESQASLELSLVTALAEGADTIAAKAALEKHHAIDAVLPFEPSNYALDFHGAALDDFKRILEPEQTRSKLVLPGTRDLPPQKDLPPGEDAKPRTDDASANKAYEAAGLTVIGNCDIVLSIWDGGESKGRGGTTSTLEVAANLGIPIIHIDAGGSQPTLMRWSGLSEFELPAEQLYAVAAKAFDEALPQVMDELARPPDQSAEREGLHGHFKECFRSLNVFLAFPLLLNLLGVRWIKRTDLVPGRLQSLSADFLGVAGDCG